MKPRTAIRAYGLNVPLANHRRIRKLKGEFSPTNHGNKVWPSSWVMVDYISRSDDFARKRVMDIGCGWGLSGVFCAKKHGASVVAVDGDDDVFAYLDVVAETNGVELDFYNLEIDEVNRNLLKGVDIIIGSDICYSEDLVDPLRRLVQRARRASVKQVLISDPGRWPFDDLAELYANRRGVEVLEWQTKRPQSTYGKILKIVF